VLKISTFLYKTSVELHNRLHCRQNHDS